MTSIAAMGPCYCTCNFFREAKRNNDGGVVLNACMQRHSGFKSLVVTALAASALLPASAAAKITEMGAMPEAVRGSCPGIASNPESCQALTKTTAYQAKVGPDRALYQAPADGRIVAYTLALGTPAKSQIAFFEKNYGGAAQAAIVVLDAGKKLSRSVVAKGPVQTLTGYMGQTVQFPLTTTLPIKKGQYVALTVPTWAPVMQLGLGADTSWRSSRAASGCGDVTVQFALLGSRSNALFRCLYKGVRLTYSATFISNATAAATK
jgi:hypothetical protein